MFKRIWKANLIFTFLFLISFSTTFGIGYYGMYLKSQIQQTDRTAEQMEYEYRSYYMVDWAEDITDRLDVKLPGLEQGILSYRVPIYGEDIVGVKSAYVVMEMNENLMEPLEYGTYFQNEKTYDRPQCIIGDAWLPDVKQDKGTAVVCINGFECEVTGILKPNTFEGSDERVFLYGASMPGEFREELICMEESMSVDYKISENADGEQIEKYEKWIQSGIFESAEEYLNMNEIDGGVSTEFTEVIPMYNKFFVCMIVFCFTNCVFLTYVWCSKKIRENMIKRVFGFPLAGIWWDGFKEIGLYEVISVLISSVICMVIEAFRGNVFNFFVTWKYGVGIMVTILLVFTFLLSIISIIYLRKIKPADTLKTTE